MSQENVEIAKKVFEAWDFGDLDTLRELYHPDVIVWPVEDWPEPGPFVGQEAVIRQGEQMRQTWESVTLELLEDFIDAGDRVLIRHAWRAVGHGPDSSNLEFTLILTIRKGKVFGFEYFRNHADALEAVGLAEQDAHAES
jgi:ketosteroid isomerase-like protein